MKLQELLEKYGNVDISEIDIEEEINFEVEEYAKTLRKLFNECNDRCSSHLYKNGELKVVPSNDRYEGLFVLSATDKIYYFDKDNFLFDTIEYDNISAQIAYYICDNQYDYDTIEELIDAILDDCDNPSDMVEEVNDIIDNFTEFMNELDSE